MSENPYLRSFLEIGFSEEMGDGETSEQADLPELTPELAVSLRFGGFRFRA
jgi:hypothetical protein